MHKLFAWRYEFLNLVCSGASMEVYGVHPVVVEQAKGFLREVLDISVDDAYDLLCRYAQANDDQLTTRVSRQLITAPNSRPAILAAMRQIQASRS